MSTHELQQAIEDLHVRYRTTSHGQIATYIPELAKANPDHFGIAIATANGAVFEVGDCDKPFTIHIDDAVVDEHTHSPTMATRRWP